jgi:thiosulfate/3-mercaptopyruvate sulfurtransferase
MTLIPGPLVSPTWLAEHLDAGDLRVLEATVFLDRSGESYTPRSGRPEWERSHILGSAFADLVQDLSDPHPTLHFTFPSPERFATTMSALGVEDGTSVVIYDRNGTMWATRLWWLLRAYGFDAAAVLDGGWSAWAGPVDAGAAPVHPGARFTPRPRPEVMASVEEVAAGPGCLINALAPEAYRAARIPGSISLPSRGVLDERGRFRSEEEIRAHLGPALGGGRVVTYCGGGISATLDAFALTLVGETDVAVYDGSMSEWLSDPARPIDRG